MRLALVNGRIVGRDQTRMGSILIDNQRIESVVYGQDPSFVEVLKMQGTEIIDCSGKYICPGLIDLHVHVYEKKTSLGVNPDQIGIQYGLGAIVDAGSAGASNFEHFYDEVISPAKTKVYAFMNISQYGLAEGMKELTDMDKLDTEAAVNAIRTYGDYIVGIKVRMSQSVVGDSGLEPLKVAKQVARQTNLPLMVHIGNGPPNLCHVLDLLDSGDIVTHVFHGKQGGIFDKHGCLTQAFLAAKKRGVLFDLGHGSASFNFEVARAASRLGVYPDTISTDIHLRNIGTKVESLLSVMEKCMAFGMTVEQVIQKTTYAAYDAINRPVAIQEGQEASLSVLEVRPVIKHAMDAEGNQFDILQEIAAVQFNG